MSKISYQTFISILVNAVSEAETNPHFRNDMKRLISGIVIGQFVELLDDIFRREYRAPWRLTDHLLIKSVNGPPPAGTRLIYSARGLAVCVRNGLVHWGEKAVVFLPFLPKHYPLPGPVKTFDDVLVVINSACSGMLELLIEKLIALGKSPRYVDTNFGRFVAKMNINIYKFVI